MALMALEDVKLHLGVTGSGDDDLLEQLQAAADGFIADHCGREFEGGSFDERFAGGDRLLVLRNYPVTSLTSLKVDTTRQFGAGTERDATTFVVHPDRGVVENLDGPFVGGAAKGGYPRAVAVAYATATDAVPAGVARASAELIGFWYRQTKTHAECGQANVLEESDGTEVHRFPWAQSGGYRVPPGVIAALAPYRNRSF